MELSLEWTWSTALFNILNGFKGYVFLYAFFPPRHSILSYALKTKELEMEQVMRSLTLDFFGKGKHKISPDKFFEIENGFLLDVRSKEEAGSISIKMNFHPNIECQNIPTDEVPDRIHEIPQDKSIAIFCPANVRSAIVYAYLLSKGFPDVRIVEGGYSALTEALKPGKVLKVVQSDKGGHF